MAIRWRLTGELICAAKCEPMEGDTYIGDRLHYELSVIQKTIVPDKNEETNGLWHWLHGECSASHHPNDVQRGVFIRTEM